MAISFYNAGDNAIYDSGQHFVPQEKYRLGYTPPATPEPLTNMPVNGGITNTKAFNNSGGGNFNFGSGNMFGEGTAVQPVNNPIRGGFSGAGTGVDPVTGDIIGGGNIVDEFGTDGNVYSETNFNNIKEEEEKKGFLSKMMNSFRQKTENLPSWAKAGMTAAGMINPFTAIPSLISKFGSGDGGPSYGIAGLDDRQKAMYNNLASNNMLFNDNGIMKTYDGKNFSQFDDESIDNYLSGKIDRFGSIDKYEKYLSKDPNQRKNLIKTLQFYKQAKKGDDSFVDATSTTITNPTVTSNVVDEFTTTPTNNDRRDTSNNTNSNPSTPGAQDSFSNKSGKGRTGYFFGGRVNYKVGGRTDAESQYGADSAGSYDSSQNQSGREQSYGGGNDNPSFYEPKTSFFKNPQTLYESTPLGNVPTGLTTGTPYGRLSAIMNLNKTIEEKELEGKVQFDSSIGPVNTRASYDTITGPEFNASYTSGPVSIGYNNLDGINANYRNGPVSIGYNNGQATVGYSKSFAKGGRVSFKNGGLASIL
jgi:hypothetical protein